MEREEVHDHGGVARPVNGLGVRGDDAEVAFAEDVGEGCGPPAPWVLDVPVRTITATELTGLVGRRGEESARKLRGAGALAVPGVVVGAVRRRTGPAVGLRVPEPSADAESPCRGYCPGRRATWALLVAVPWRYASVLPAELVAEALPLRRSPSWSARRDRLHFLLAPWRMARHSEVDGRSPRKPIKATIIKATKRHERRRSVSSVRWAASHRLSLLGGG